MLESDLTERLCRDNSWRVVTGAHTDDPSMLPFLVSRNVGITVEDARNWPSLDSAIAIDGNSQLGPRGVVVTRDFRVFAFVQGELKWCDFDVGTNSRPWLVLLD